MNNDILDTVLRELLAVRVIRSIPRRNWYCLRQPSVSQKDQHGDCYCPPQACELCVEGYPVPPRASFHYIVALPLSISEQSLQAAWAHSEPSDPCTEYLQGGKAADCLHRSRHHPDRRILASMLSGIPYYNIWKWDLTDEEWDLLKVTMREIKQLPIRFLYTDTFQMIKYACDDKTQPSDLIVFDYLQLIHYGFTETRDGTQDLTPNDYLKEFKKLARKYKAAVIVTSQLARKLERRKDKHPRISDLRIENLTADDYDQAFLIYREAYYDLDAPKDSAELTVVCPKKAVKETVKLHIIK
ncbi:MAG: DnaB-like helicase C-terminal domain-containing protein [Lachnospiraceae bacterium]|nr:DnaB-like helicase C-terminal domain-containing protein [Lachnospiraceae bacterium]